MKNIVIFWYWIADCIDEIRLILIYKDIKSLNQEHYDLEVEKEECPNPATEVRLQEVNLSLLASCEAKVKILRRIKNRREEVYRLKHA